MTVHRISEHVWRLIYDVPQFNKMKEKEKKVSQHVILYKNVK